VSIGQARGPSAIELPDGVRPYEWVPTSEAIAARHGLSATRVLRFDRNTPPLPGVPQVALAESFSRLNEYHDGSYRDLREAAASYVGGGVGWEQIVVGAGADELVSLVARTYLAPGKRAALTTLTYSLYGIASRLAGAEVGDEMDGASVIWRCNPNNPTGDVVAASVLVALARANSEAAVVVDEAYVEYGGESVVPYLRDAPNLIVLRTLSKAFGFAGLRVGYAVCSPDVAVALETRRAPGPVASPSAAIAAAALRNPRTDVAETLAERDRIKDALREAGYDVPEGGGNWIWLPGGERLADRLEADGIVVRRFPGGIRITPLRPSENDLLLIALGATPGPRPGRSATVIRTTTETAVRITLDLDGTGRSRIATGIGFLDHLLTLMSFHAGFDLDCLAGGDLDVDHHHTVEDVLASLGTALTEALGAREGVARYGSAVVPMDESRAVAAVDLVRRPHAEIALAFSGERVGELAVSLLAHALERFAIEAGCTVHVESAGKDDHHIAEAAVKALGQALREAVAPGDAGIRSTKGAA
jgi:histidinol-phosphate/aromatic aminotransferase/cobyric acid decarboxylase-like protein/imidazoleglycerol phosphate dehydratase HisB